MRPRDTYPADKSGDEGGVLVLPQQIPRLEDEIISDNTLVGRDEIVSFAVPEPETEAEVQEVRRFESTETVQGDVIVGGAGPPESGRIDDIDIKDANDYTMRQMGPHNVVLAALPRRQYGLVNATAVAKDTARTFPNIRFILMVGVGGGVPTNHDIRLGDIVVSSAGYGNGGVIQYGYGHAVQNYPRLQATYRYRWWW
ncbi:hypothetical protein OQA88_6983 [Cercophora sp. LCS_1]